MPTRHRNPPNLAARGALSANVREARRRMGLSQEELAHRAGLARSYVSTIERGLANIALDHLVSLAEVLGVEPSELAPTFTQIAAADRQVPRRV